MNIKFAAVFPVIILALSPVLWAQVKSQKVDSKAPEAAAAEIQAILAGSAMEVLDDAGMPMLKVWLAKELAGSAKPAGPKGTILFPYLSEGQLMGVVQVISQVGDYRDQPVAPGIYTLRYGLQPVNGDHLGASSYRDFACLVPAKIDRKPEVLAKKALEKSSAEAAGTSHPAIMMFLPPKDDAKPGDIVRDDENDRTSLVLPFAVNGGGAKTEVKIQWVVQGRAPV
ncbi:MAG: hypothetical protein ACKO5E_16990 [bacterium]